MGAVPEREGVGGRRWVRAKVESGVGVGAEIGAGAAVWAVRRVAVRRRWWLWRVGGAASASAHGRVLCQSKRDRRAVSGREERDTSYGDGVVGNLAIACVGKTRYN